jgi:hypothetical protein
MSELASAFGALEGAGLTAYEVSQGAPVSVSSVGGITTTSIGSVFSGSSGTLIAIIIGLAIIFAFSRKRA